jgi:hypothetical protein
LRKKKKKEENKELKRLKEIMKIMIKKNSHLRQTKDQQSLKKSKMSM